MKNASTVRLIPSPNREEVPDLLIIDRQIAKDWDESPQNIWVYEDQTLASLNVKDLKAGNIIWSNVRWIESKDLFLPEFTFIDIPLSGVKNNSKQIEQPQNYHIFKDYPLKEYNALTEVPVLEVWPHFQAEGWKEYYAFYYDAEYGDQTFQVSFPEAKDPHIFQDGRGSYQLTCLEEFPSYINCQDRAKNLIGLNEWQELKEGNFKTKLDLFLRLEGDNWLKTKRAFVEDEPDFQGLLRLIALGTSGLYFYVGTILGVLYEERKYSKKEITPVYIGGRGSPILNWLAIGGRFNQHSEVNELFSQMLSKGSGFKYIEEKTRLSQRPQDEVACG
ncbi:MAG: hypothetical protein AB4426_14035 [Xenococcaceae cyanobacterium]